MTYVSNLPKEKTDAETQKMQKSLCHACGNKIVKMSIDEYETIRLIDWEKLTQVQCAEQMGIARTTVTGIYDSARTKLADALIHGKMLMIQGGDYTLCSGDKENCSRRCCKKEKEKER